MDNRLIDDGKGLLDMDVLDDIQLEIANKIRSFLATKEESEVGILLLQSSIGPLELAFTVTHKEAKGSFHSILGDVVRLVMTQQKIKLWMINDAYWYAAESKECALAQFAKDQKLNADEPREAVEVPDEDLDTLLFEEEEGAEAVTFRTHLNFLIFNKTEFPCSFAFDE